MTPLKVITWNVANALNDESSPGRFGLRVDVQIELLMTLHPDILMIQEIRTCKNRDGTSIMTPLDIAYKFESKLRMDIAGFEKINTTSLTFWRLTLYNPLTVWSMGGTAVRSFNVKNTDYVFGKDFGREMLFNQFCPCDTKTNTIFGSKSFWVCNVHFPLRLDDKLVYADLIKRAITEVCRDEQVIIAGDCNVFIDDGGDIQLQRMSILEFVEHTVNNGIETTFVSFPWDKIQAKSHLDYVFTRKDVSTTLKITSITSVDLSDKQISDHFPLIIMVEL